MMMIQRDQFVTLMRMETPLFVIPLLLIDVSFVPIKDDGYCFTWNM